MSYFLNTDDVLEALLLSGHPRYARHKAAAEALLASMASDLAAHLEVSSGEADFQGKDFGGLCVPMQPRYAGQAIPEALQGLDDETEWGDPCPAAA